MVTLLEGVLSVYSQGGGVFKCEGWTPPKGVDKTLCLSHAHISKTKPVIEPYIHRSLFEIYCRGNGGVRFEVRHQNFSRK